ncbi:MAG TPA: hypothetical protein VM103_00045, partial [Candidatus Paceibacterota bacterium]|nr:hypothetical protein [Candidatus Paceibacterota bacterium]
SDDLKLEHHKSVVEEFLWNPRKVSVLPRYMRRGGLLADQASRYKYAKGLASRRLVMNANVLHYLLTHPQCIPEQWKELHLISFLGTIYRSDSGGLVVPYLYSDRVNSHIGYHGLGLIGEGGYSIAVFKD